MLVLKNSYTWKVLRLDSDLDMLCGLTSKKGGTFSRAGVLVAFRTGTKSFDAIVNGVLNLRCR